MLGTREANVPLSNVPSSISIVDREEIQKEQAVSNRIEDILSRQVPGFNPTNNALRSIRGRTAQVFVNGVPVNEQLNATLGTDLKLVRPDHLSGIEVSRGANSAYGFGSPGGIISLSTPRAQSEELELRTIVRESINPHRIGGSHQTSLYQSAAQIVGPFDYHLGGSIGFDGAEFDPDGNLALGFDGPAGVLNAKELLGAVDGSFGLDLGSYGSLRLTGTFDHVDVTEEFELEPGVYRETFGRLREFPAGEDTDSFRRAYTVNLSYENADVLGSQVKLELLASEMSSSFFNLGDPAVRFDTMSEYRGFRSSVTTPLEILLSGASITYGFDFFRNRLFTPAFSADTGELVMLFSPDATLDSYAPYGQLEVPIGDFVLSGGVRHEEYRGHVETGGVGLPGGIEGGDIDSFDLTLFNAGLVYHLNQQTDLYATFSQGAEITQIGRAAFSGAETAAQIDPQPAKSNQYEVGARGDWSSFSYSLAGFYTESDLLSALQINPANPDGPSIPLREPRKIWGVEFTADWRIDQQWGVGGVLTWLDGIRKTDTGDTRRIGSREVPPVLVTGYVDYKPFPWWRNTLQLNYRGSRAPFGDSTDFDEGRVDDLLLVNVSAGFDVGPGELQIGAQNLFNTEYTSIPAEASNIGFLWLPEQGTRVTVSYSVKW